MAPKTLQACFICSLFWFLLFGWWIKECCQCIWSFRRPLVLVLLLGMMSGKTFCFCSILWLLECYWEVYGDWIWFFGGY